MMKDVLKAFVFAVTGINEEDIDKLIEHIEDFFKNSKFYLNNGVLYDSKNITDRLDKEFGNYGINQDVQNHTFLAFAQSLNMCRLSVMGVNNINALVGKYYNGTPLFKEKPVRFGFNKLDITIRTGKNTFSGTDGNVYFAVTLNNSKVL